MEKSRPKWKGAASKGNEPPERERSRPKGKGAARKEPPERSRPKGAAKTRSASIRIHGNGLGTNLLSWLPNRSISGPPSRGRTSPGGAFSISLMCSRGSHASLQPVHSLVHGEVSVVRGVRFGLRCGVRRAEGMKLKPYGSRTLSKCFSSASSVPSRPSY